MDKRMQMVGGEMKRVLSESLRKIKDPEFTELTSVLEVSTTPDLDFAYVVLSIYSDSEEKRKKTFEAINRAGGFLRHEIATNMKIKKAPKLVFSLDESAKYSARINSILETLNVKNEEEKSD